MRLVTPAMEFLDGYTAALKRGWSSSTIRDVSAVQLAEIAGDAGAFIANMARVDGGSITDPDGSKRERLPGPILWMWADAFCGSINLRYVVGTEDLPPSVSGHIGYAVVPWMQRRGLATAALGFMLPVARAAGLARVLVTCDVDNEGSRKVITRNGGVRAEGFPQISVDKPTKDGFWIAT